MHQDPQTPATGALREADTACIARSSRESGLEASLDMTGLRPAKAFMPADLAGVTGTLTPT